MTSQLETYVLICESGDRVIISNFGARICQWQVKVANEVRDIVVGYPNLEDYLSDPYYHGAIVGPYANRIENAQVEIDGKSIALDANQAPHHLHGGKDSVSDLYWQCKDYNGNSVTLTCTLPHSHNGYPGPIYFEVSYRLLGNLKYPNGKAQCQLEIDFKVNSKRKTLIGPTTHPYFNLSSQQTEIAGHKLQVNAEKVAAYYQGSGIPTGELLPVADTDYDYRQPRNLPSFADVPTLDHNFFIKETLSTQLLIQGKVISPDEKLCLKVYSDYPCVQVYLGKNKDWDNFEFEAICLEPQFAPDSPNQANFDYRFIEAGDVFTAKVIYQVVKQ